MNLRNHIPAGHQNNKTHRVCLENIKNLILMDSCTLRCVEIKNIIEDQAPRHNQKQHLKVGAHRKRTYIRITV